MPISFAPPPIFVLAMLFTSALLRSCLAAPRSGGVAFVAVASRALSTVQLPSPPASSSPSNSSPKQSITIRKATLNDISQIQQCNLQNLPENYSTDWFRTCLQYWPELCLVATTEQMDEQGGLESSAYDEAKGHIVGYVFARVDGLQQTSTPSSLWQSPYQTAPFSSPPPRKPVFIGHINSLAVSAPYRRCHVAKALMQVMHRQLVNTYDCDTVSLHVRASNSAALRLYTEKNKYYCAEVLKAYYEDGEDALLLRCRGLRQFVMQGQNQA